MFSYPQYVIMTTANKQQKEQRKLLNLNLPIVINNEQEMIYFILEVDDHRRQQEKIKKEIDQENRMRKCLELLNTGFPTKADEISKEFTEQQQIEYEYFCNTNFERLKQITMQRVKKIKEGRKRKAEEELEALEELIPVVTID